MHATADSEHTAALELLALVMAADRHLSEVEIDTIRQISDDWRDGDFTFEKYVGPAIVKAQDAISRGEVLALIDDIDQRISSRVLRRALFSAAREVAGVDADSEPRGGHDPRRSRRALRLSCTQSAAAMAIAIIAATPISGDRHQADDASGGRMDRAVALVGRAQQLVVALLRPDQDSGAERDHDQSGHAERPVQRHRRLPGDQGSDEHRREGSPLPRLCGALLRLALLDGYVAVRKPVHDASTMNSTVASSATIDTPTASTQRQPRMRQRFVEPHRPFCEGPAPIRDQGRDEGEARADRPPALPHRGSRRGSRPGRGRRRRAPARCGSTPERCARWPA